MKKTLIALAALAATSAFAQSSVVWYGYGDFGIGQDIAASGVAKLQVNPNTADVGGIRVGIKVKEDLGGGMAMNGQFETSTYSADTGKTGDADTAFRRATWIGLSGGFGEFKIGRQVRQAVAVEAGFSAGGYRGTSASINAALSPDIYNNIGASSRLDSELTYITPDMGGLQARIGYVLPGEGNAAGNTNQKTDIGVKYAAGPLALGLGYMVQDSKDANYGLHGSYDFGAAKVLLGYYDVAVPFGTDKHQTGFSLGATVPMGTISIFTEYANNNTASRDSFELGADYALSKRTAISLAVNKTKDMDMGYFFGIRTSF